MIDLLSQLLPHLTPDDLKKIEEAFAEGRSMVSITINGNVYLGAKHEKPKFTQPELDILEAIGNDSISADELAAKAGYENDSSFRKRLKSLVQRNALVHERPNYRKPMWV